MTQQRPTQTLGLQSTGLSMKRLLAVLLLLMGGLSVEAVKPVQCLLIANSRSHQPRSPER